MGAHMSGEKPRDNLRYRAMSAFAGSAARPGCWHRPDSPTSRRRWLGSNADALVYLLPRGRGRVRSAVVVDPAVTSSPLPLPGCTRSGQAGGGSSQARRAAEAAAGARADRGQAARPRDLALRARRVCDWAWLAAIRPVLGALAKQQGTTVQAGAGDPPRIVLVPGGELGVIPWHAARHPTGDARGGDAGRRACRHAVFLRLVRAAFMKSGRGAAYARGRRSRC